MASKILLVEDDNNLREIYEARLQAEGYEIVTAKDGEAALVAAKAQKPDLIISDVMMPRISGFEMLDILRNTDELKYTKVIMLTALGQADDKTRADSLGADRYLVKSQVTLEDIVKAAHELTDAPAPPAADTPGPAVAESTPAASAAMPATPAPPVMTPPPVIPVVQDPGIPALAPMPAPMATQPAAPAPLAAMPPSTPPAIPQPMPIPITPAPQPVIPAPPAGMPAPAVNTPAAPLPPLGGAPAPRPAYMTDFSAPMPDTALQPAPLPPAAALDTPTAAEEQAAVTAQIASFAGSPASPTPPTPANSAAQNDAAALTAAMNSLSANAPVGTTPPAASASAPMPDLAPSAVQPAAANQPAPASTNDTVTIANKKVIQPIQREAKPGLDELLAREEAKSPPAPFGQVTVPPAANTLPFATPTAQPLPAPHQPGATFAPNPTPPAPQTPPQTFSAPPAGVDPGSIAL